MPAGEQAWEEQSHTSLAVLVGIRLLKVNSTPNLVCFVDGRRALNQLLLFDATIPPTLPLFNRVLWLRVASYRSNSIEGAGVFSNKCKIEKK